MALTSSAMPWYHRLLIPACALLMLVTIPAASQPGYERDAEALEALRTRISALNQRLSEKQEQRDALRAALQDAERAASAALEALTATREQLARLDRRMGDADARARAAEAALAKQQDALARQVRAAWLLGRQPQIKLLFEQDAPDRLMRLRAWFDRLGTAAARDIAETRAALSEQQAAIEELAQARSARSAALQEQETLLAQLRTRRAQREKTVAAIERQLRDDQQSLSRARADEAELEELLDGLRNALRDIPADLGRSQPLTSLRGELPWPLQGKILAAFGQKRSSGLPWKGIWVAANTGTPAHAIAAGRVAWAGWMHRYGLVVVLEHDGGFFSLYGHAQRSLRRVGDWVAAGEAVVTAGDSGGQAQSGLYLELRNGKDPVDPVGWLRSRS